jgi:hypothetical protein
VVAVVSSSGASVQALLLDAAAKTISPNDFADLDQLAERIIAFQDRYNTTATPFDWTYTRDDLNAFLHRLASTHRTSHSWKI